jgi:hypothetical protein
LPHLALVAPEACGLMAARSSQNFAKGHVPQLFVPATISAVIA